MPNKSQETKVTRFNPINMADDVQEEGTFPKVELVKIPDDNFRYDEWNKLYDIVSWEYFVPVNPSIPGVGGKCFWPHWSITSRKLKMARRAWYDVQHVGDENEEEKKQSKLRTALSLSASPKSTPSTSFRKQSEKKRAHQQKSATPPSRHTPSRGVKSVPLSYAEFPNEDEIIIDDDDDDEEAFPLPKRSRMDSEHNKGKIC